MDDLQDFDVAPEYLGIVGSSTDCLNALGVTLQFGPAVHAALLVTKEKEEEEPWPHEHLIVLQLENADFGRPIVIPSGFASGYGGAGPRALSRAIILLSKANVSVKSKIAAGLLFHQINIGRATHEQLENLARLGKGGTDPWDLVDMRDADLSGTNPPIWSDWIDLRVPRGLVSANLDDLVQELERDHRDAVFKAFRRLESSIRSRMQGLGAITESEAVGARLVNNAFGDKGKLGWSDIDPTSSEYKGRRDLLAGAFSVLRSPRVHNEDDPFSRADHIRDFILVGWLLDLVESSEPR